MPKLILPGPLRRLVAIRVSWPESNTRVCCMLDALAGSPSPSDRPQPLPTATRLVPSHLPMQKRHLVPKESRAGYLKSPKAAAEDLRDSTRWIGSVAPLYRTVDASLNSRATLLVLSRLQLPSLLPLSTSMAFASDLDSEISSQYTASAPTKSKTLLTV